MSIKLSKAAAEVAKLIRMVNFFKGRLPSERENRAYLLGQLDALDLSDAIGREERRYLRTLLRDGPDPLDFGLCSWENCIAHPGYFPYGNHLKDLAAAEMKGAAVANRDAMPSDAFPCSPDGISFHRFDFYTDRIRKVETDRQLDPYGREMKLILLDETIGTEWYAAEVAIAITVMMAAYRASPVVLGFESPRGDLKPEHVLEGARRAKKFDEDFPATWDENEHDYRLMHPGEPFLLDYYWLVIRKGDGIEVVREPLLDPLQCPY